MIAGGLTMSDLANSLARVTNRIVMDRTNLRGRFDIDLQFNPEGLPGLALPDRDRPAAIDDRPSIFTALQEQLGLRLESTRGTVDVLVIDHAEPPLPD